MPGEGGEPSTTNGLQFTCSLAAWSCPNVRECSGDLLPVIVYCTAGIHGGMEESAWESRV